MFEAVEEYNGFVKKSTFPLAKLKEENHAQIH
jgi:hypothetical protein